MSDPAPSTNVSASSELKAGHAPASKTIERRLSFVTVRLFVVKVGGMRVGAPRPRHTSQGEDKAAGDNAEAGQEGEENNAKEGQDGADNATGEANA